MVGLNVCLMQVGKLALVGQIDRLNSQYVGPLRSPVVQRLITDGSFCDRGPLEG